MTKERRQNIILKKNGGKCVYCGETATTVDHVVSLAHGGSKGPGNLVPACFPCNNKKGCGCPQNGVCKNNAQNIFIYSPSDQRLEKWFRELIRQELSKEKK